MKEAKISIWNNRYTEIYDFTPNSNVSNFKVCTKNNENIDDTIIDQESLE